MLVNIDGDWHDGSICNFLHCDCEKLTSVPYDVRGNLLHHHLTQHDQIVYEFFSFFLDKIVQLVISILGYTTYISSITRRRQLCILLDDLERMQLTNKRTSSYVVILAMRH